LDTADVLGAGVAGLQAASLGLFLRVFFFAVDFFTASGFSAPPDLGGLSAPLSSSAM
jgi:hypothetical protein